MDTADTTTTRRRPPVDRAAYRGRDRRSATGDPAPPGPATHRLVWWAGVAGAVLLVSMCVLTAGVGVLAPALDVAAVAWLATTTQAGLAVVLAWRVCGRSRDLGAAGALLVVGVAAPLAYYVEILTPDTGAWAVRSALGALAVAMLVRARGEADVDAGVRLSRLVASGVALVLLTALLGLGVAALVPAPPPVVLVSGAVVPSLALAVVALWPGADPALRTLGVALGCAALAAPILHLGDGPSTVNALAWGIGLAMFGAGCGGVIGWAVQRFRTAQSYARSRDRRLLDEIGRAAARRAEEAERRHDARAALAAVQVATEVLLVRSQQLDEPVRRELTAGVQAELRRLATMLSASRTPAAPPATDPVERAS